MEKHINKKVIIAISFTTIMIMAGLADLEYNYYNNNYNYSNSININNNGNGNIHLSLIGKTVYINSFNHLSPLKINVYSINNGKITNLNFNITNIAVKKNSFDIFENNSEMKMSIILSLKNNKIYMYNIFKNNMNKNISFIDVMSIKTMKSQYSISNNNNIKTMNNNTAIPSTYYNINTNNLNINWLPDASIFHYGLVYRNNYNNIELPFGPINLHKNYTYSMHPIIIYNSNASNGIQSDIIPGGGGPVFEYAPTNMTCYVYNSNGKEIGTYTLTSYDGTKQPDTTVYKPANPIDLNFATGASYPNADGVWKIKQTLSYGGNELGCSGGYMKIMHVHIADQNSADNTLTNIDGYLISAVLSAVGFHIPNPLHFISKASNSPCTENPYSNTMTGEIEPIGFFVNEYCPIWQSTNIGSKEYGKKSYMFGIGSDFKFSLGNLNPNTVDAYLVDYSVQVTFESGYVGSPSYYTSPCSTLVTGINMCYTSN